MGVLGNFFTWSRPKAKAGRAWPRTGDTRVRWGTPQVWVEGGYKDTEGLSPNQLRKVRRAGR